MRNIITTICLLTALAGVAGCAQFNVRPSRTDTTTVAEPTVATDTRTNEQLAAENARLRQQMATQENYNTGWKTAIDTRENDKRTLQRQRDDLKKERDQAKKAANRGG